VPGIFGLVRTTGDDRSGGDFRRRRQFAAMAAAMQYEPFYACRQYESADLGILAGWSGPTDDVMSRGPVAVRDAGITLFTAGEPRCDRLSDAGRRANDRSDRVGTRIVGHYERRSDEFPSTVRGLFAGFLVDERRQQSVLFGDRLGMERLFTYEDAGAFFFSSEAKAILAAVPEARSFDPQGLSEFLACGCTLGGASLFRGIRVLPAGTVLTFDKQSAPRSRKYFDCRAWETLEPLPEGEWLERLGAALDNAVERDATEHPRVAVSLTGGLDSRMIMACLKARAGTVPCYTFGSMYRDTYDVRVARTVAALCRQPHEVLVLGEEFIAGLRAHFEKAAFISDGTLGLSGAAELYLNRLARRVAPVRITGNYGGELLRGFRAFKASMPNGDFLKPEMAERVRAAAEAFSGMTGVPPLSFTLFHQAPSGYGRYAIERSQVTVRSPFLDDDVVQLLYRRPRGEAVGSEPSARLIGRRRPDLLAVPTDRGLLGGGGTLEHGARRIHREGLFKAEYWTSHGAPHWLAAISQRVAGQSLERLFLGRHKFVHPGPWGRRGLDDYTREVLVEGSSSALAAHVDFNRVKAMLEQHLAGKRNYWEELDKLVTLALTCRVLLRAAAADVRNPSERIAGANVCNF
jgi:asparagine synthase (glutamine-hydrolysing)